MQVLDYHYSGQALSWRLQQRQAFDQARSSHLWVTQSHPIKCQQSAFIRPDMMYVEVSFRIHPYNLRHLNSLHSPICLKQLINILLLGVNLISTHLIEALCSHLKYQIDF